MNDLKITYRDEPAGAREATAPSMDGAEEFCSVPDILTDGNQAPQHATLEDHYWVLGSDYRFFPETPKGLTWGVFSKQISGEDGTFAQPLTLVLALSAVYSSVGVSFEFDPYGPTWCCDLQITWWREGEQIHSKDFQPDGWQFAALEEVHNFDMVTVTFRKMSAGYRYLKLQALSYGITRVFTSEECFSVDLYQDTDLLSDMVATNTLDFSLINKSAINFLFQRRQPMRVEFGEELLGIYYISTSSKCGSRYSIHSVDMVGLAEMAGDHLGGIYNGVRAEEVVADILGSDIPWSISDELKDIPLHGHLPIASRRENLRQVAFALCAMVVTGHRSCIEVTRPQASLSGTFTATNSYENGEVEVGALVTAVRVTAYAYALEDTTTTLYEGTLNGDEEVSFSTPAGELSISGGEIIAQNANYALIRGTGGQVVLTGRQYTAQKRVYTKKNPLKNANDAENVVEYTDMTLVNAYNAQEVLNSCYAYQLRQETIKGKVRSLTERPGDYVEAITDDGEVRRGHLLSLDYVPSTNLAADVVILADHQGEVSE